MRSRGAGAVRAKIEIEVAWRLRGLSKAPALLRRVALHVACREGFRSGALSIAVVGGRAMASLHQRHTGIAGPTDVLTFDLGTDVKTRWIEGEIVVCRDVARRAAAESRSDRAIERELALYVAHGVLHLAGYDDRDRAAFRKIHSRENELLSQLSLGPVFGSILD